MVQFAFRLHYKTHRTAPHMQYIVSSTKFRKHFMCLCVLVCVYFIRTSALYMCSGRAAFLDVQNIMPNAETCTINNRAFFVFGSLVAFYIPMVVMVSAFAATIRLLSEKAKFAQSHPDSEKWHR